MRASTPAPYPSKVTKTFKNRKYPSSPCLPHLQPLLEERFGKGSSNTEDLVRQFQRHGIACEHGDQTELFQIPNRHGKLLQLHENKWNSSFSRSFPRISNEDIEEVQTLEANTRNIKQKELRRSSLDGNIQNICTSRQRTSSVRSTNSLPSLGKQKGTRKNSNRRMSEHSMLSKHIQQEEKNYDPARNKDVIFEKYFETQR